jgi:hypothetical protein
MQPQTMNALTIAQKIQSCICCIVVVSRHHYGGVNHSSVANAVLTALILIKAAGFPGLKSDIALRRSAGEI